MKKLLYIALCCLLLAGCGQKAADPAVLGPALLEGAGFPEEMVVLSGDMTAAVFQVDMDTVSACYAAVSGGAGADELMVLTAGEEEAAEAVYDLLEARIAYRRDSFAGYSPAEAAKLEDAILTRENCTVIYCVCPDPDAAREIIRN